MPTPHLYTWPRFRGVFVGYIEILRYTSHLPLGGLGSSFLFEKARLQPCVCLVPLVPLILLYTVLYLTCLVSSLHLHIRRLFYDLSLYPVSLYSIVVAQPFRSKSRSRARQSITTLKSPLAVSLCSTLLRFNRL